MEHLQARDPSQPIDIQIPYVAIEEYEADGQPSDDKVLFHFKSYWDRKGWTRHPRTGDLDFKNRIPETIPASLQTALYFGCLMSVFRTAGVTVHTRDFLYQSPNTGGQTVVRTTRLRDLIAAWAKRESFATGPVVSDPQNPKYTRGESIREMLEWTHYYTGMFSRHWGGGEGTMMPEPHRTQLQLVELSIKAMGETMCAALAAIYGYETSDMPTWGPSPVLEERLRRNGWCVSDMPFFPESPIRASISADYFFGGMVCPRPRDHSMSAAGCTTAICAEYLKVVDPKTYTQAHVSAGCTCKPMRIPDTSVKLVTSNLIPVVTWDGTKLDVSMGSSQNPYVALSHVWSDGLGNDGKTNSLPRCWLSRLQFLVNDLYSAPHRSPNGEYATKLIPAASKPTFSRDSGTENKSNSKSKNKSKNKNKNTVMNIPFWIDTLCVPVGDPSIRNIAIRQMASVYRLADRVLVLDSFLRALPLHEGADIVDKFLRIHLSTWHHRLWTLQEGQLASRLFFQFEGGAESFYDMSYNDVNLNIDAELRQGKANSPGGNLMGMVEELCSPVKQLCATMLERFYRFGEVGGGGIVNSSGAIGTISTSSSGGAGIGRSGDIVLRMRSCARYLRSRQTSRFEDEPVCLATILGLDILPLVVEKDPVERMARFYDSVRLFDPRIIFHGHARLPKDGYRWAPKSFLHEVPDLIEMRESDPAALPMAPSLLTPGGGGLPVRMAGIELQTGMVMSLPQPGTSMFFRPWMGQVPGMQMQQHPWGMNPWGMPTLGVNPWGMPALGMNPWGMPALGMNQFQFSGMPGMGSASQKLPWWAYTYRIEVLPHADGQNRQPTGAWTRYAIILPAQLDPVAVDALPAILGIIDPATPVNPISLMAPWTTYGSPGNQVPAYTAPYPITVTYLCRVRVIGVPPDKAPYGLRPGCGLAFSTNQEWRIR
ncbi:hypothetical protein DL768_005169 [Monosporascus sp. mg162]|nr:hypothetical protein DL768_005169 [Monosporascus sp. mg162]